MWAGIAGTVINSGSSLEIAVSIHDSVYSTDFASAVIAYQPNDPEKVAKNIEDHVLQTLRKFSRDHLCKFLGAGVTLSLLREVGIDPSFGFVKVLNGHDSPQISALVFGLTWMWFPSSSTSNHSIPIH